MFMFNFKVFFDLDYDRLESELQNINRSIDGIDEEEIYVTDSAVDSEVEDLNLIDLSYCAEKTLHFQKIRQLKGFERERFLTDVICCSDWKRTYQGRDVFVLYAKGDE